MGFVGEITIHESAGPSGVLVRTRLAYEDGRFAIAAGGDLLALPEGAVDAVMKRYGKPLALPSEELHPLETLEIGGGRRLVRFRFMPRYDVIARDYIALIDADPANEPVCELATAVTAALDHLARAARP